MKYFITLVFSMIFITAFSQIAPDKYYVQFMDKANSPYTLDEPLAFLSQRALDRREKQQIALAENDLPVNPQYLEQVAAAGATLLFPTKWLNGVTVSTTSQQVLDAIAALPFVQGVRSLPEEPLKQVIKEKTFFAAEAVGDVYGPKTSSLKQTGSFNYGNGFTQINQINGIPLHDAGFRGQDMVIAILDGGFTDVQTHVAFDSLWLNNQILGNKDFTNPGGNVFSESSHGTSVLSTIGANVPGQLIGTAPKASFWLLRSESVSSEHLIEEYNWVSAAEFADSVGVDIINSSLGYIDFDFPQWTHTYPDMDGTTCVATIGADIASDKGILVVNSAGNSGGDSFFPYIGSPADGFKVFSIGAVDGTGARASFSSIGPTYDGRIKPDVMAMGQGTALANGNNNFTYGNGTSFSSPVMAGMTACLWQSNPNFTNTSIREAIKMSASNATQPNSTFGYGIPDFYQANSFLTSIDTGEQRETNLMKVAPNPFQTVERIQVFSQKPCLVRIFNSNARLVGEIAVANYQTNALRQVLNNLKSGFYTLSISTDDEVQIQKLIKIN
jgi:subtilisin family serine protease